jgi:hypothetical protein
MVPAAAASGDIAIMDAADAVIAAHSRIGGTQTGQTRQRRFELMRRMIEVAAGQAGA